MKAVFFEIPASDFERAVTFYQNVFNNIMTVSDCGDEKMAFFPGDDGQCPGAVSYAEGFLPSKEGVLVSLAVEDIGQTADNIERFGGAVVQGKTKIESEGMGWFAIFTDSEGNRVGLYSDN